MAAHGICFDFYYQPKPSQIGQNGLAAAAGTRLAAQNDQQSTQSQQTLVSFLENTVHIREGK